MKTFKYLLIENKSKILTYTFYGLVSVFMLLYLISLDYGSIASQNLNFKVFALATILGVFSIYWGSFIWLFVLKSLGAKNLNKRALFYVYGKSWLGRYIPGTAPWILGKIGFASEYGIPKKKLAVSSILEAIYQIIATVVVSLLLIFVSSKSLDLPIFSWIILLIGIITSIAIIQPKIFVFLANKAMKLLKKPEIEPDNQTSLSLNLKGIALYSIGALSTGFAMYLLANSIIPLNSYSDMFYIMGASNLAAVIGMMAIFVPSGIGVREVTFVAMLTIIIPVEQAILISVISRFWSILVDLLFFSLGYIFKSRKGVNKHTREDVT